MFCEHCGSRIEDVADVCVHCGSVVRGGAFDTVSVSQPVAKTSLGGCLLMIICFVLFIPAIPIGRSLLRRRSLLGGQMIAAGWLGVVFWSAIVCIAVWVAIVYGFVSLV